MSKEHSVFYRAWNSNRGKKIVSAVYSLGAAIVILGALFKILHLTGANEMLMLGMTTEALIFALGIFETPHKEFDWGHIFEFKEDTQKMNLVGGGSKVASSGVGVNYSESISDSDVKKLSEGIKNLSETANGLQVIANVAVAANGLAKNIETASEAAVNFTTTQQKLNETTEKLSVSYSGITSDVDTAINNTKGYAEKVAEMNKSLGSINSVYEIQLRHLQSQNEGLSLQAESIRNVSGKLDEIVGDLNKMKDTTGTSFEETQKYLQASKKLAKQVEDLNAVYGNMLNALS
jgi:gliding motility-associated protein GldL